MNGGLLEWRHPVSTASQRPGTQARRTGRRRSGTRAPGVWAGPTHAKVVRTRLDVRMTVRHAVRMSRRTNLILPEALVAEVDRIAGPRMRSAYIADAVEARLRRDRLKEVVARTAGAWTAADYPEFATSDKVVAWVRARRVETTGPHEEA